MRLRRIAAMAAAVTAAAVILPGPLAAAASPAHAAPAAGSLGTVTVAPASGDVDTRPMFATATASSTCPANYGTNAGLRIGRAGTDLEKFANLVRVGSDNNYDTVVPKLAPDRSMRAAFGATPVTDGDYTIVISCTGESTGDHPDVFSTTIRVTGTAWTVTGGGGPGPTAGPTTGPTAGPTGGSGTNKQTLNTQVGPATTTPSPSPTGTPGGGLPRTGSPVARIAAIGLGLIAAGVLLVRIVRRRRLA